MTIVDFVDLVERFFFYLRTMRNILEQKLSRLKTNVKVICKNNLHEPSLYALLTMMQSKKYLHTTKSSTMSTPMMKMKMYDSILR